MTARLRNACERVALRAGFNAATNGSASHYLHARSHHRWHTIQNRTACSIGRAFKMSTADETRREMTNGAARSALTAKRQRLTPSSAYARLAILIQYTMQVGVLIYELLHPHRDCLVQQNPASCRIPATHSIGVSSIAQGGGTGLPLIRRPSWLSASSFCGSFEKCHQAICGPSLASSWGPKI